MPQKCLLNNLSESIDFINISGTQVDEYLTERGSEVEQEVAADITLQILDFVLKSEQSLNSQQVIDSIKMHDRMCLLWWTECCLISLSVLISGVHSI